MPSCHDTLVKPETYESTPCEKRQEMHISSLHSDCLTKILFYLEIRQVGRTLTTASLWMQAGACRMPMSALRVPGDIQNLNCALTLFRLHSRKKRWTEILLGPGRFHLNYSNLQLSLTSSEREQHQTKLDCHCRHILIQDESNITIRGATEPTTGQPLTQILGKVVIRNSKKINLVGLSICSATSGILILDDSSAQISACQISHCGRSGLVVGGGSRCNADRCTFSENNACGASAVGPKSWLRLASCMISENRRSGVFAKIASHIDICGGTKICGNLGCGLHPHNSGIILIQSINDVAQWKGVSSCHTPPKNERRGICLSNNRLGNIFCSSGGRVLEYRRSRASLRPYAVRVRLKSTLKFNLGQHHGQWGTLVEKRCLDGVLCVRLDANQNVSQDYAYKVPRDELVFICHENIMQKRVLSERIRIYDINQACLRRYAYHV